MTAIEDRPDLEERYARATETTNLTVEERRGAVDLLIAAGWVLDGLGTSLYRLRTEYDGARTEQSLAVTYLRTQMAQARDLERQGAAEGDEALLAQAAALRDEAEKTALSNRLMVLIHLKTLASTKQQLGAWAIGQATRQGFMKSNAYVCELVGRALEYWLDPLCPHCDGRGFTGSYGAPMVFCGGKHGCGGTGRRRVRLGKTDADQGFGRYLLAGMDRKTESVGRQMKRFLRRPSTQGLAKSPQELQLRLAALRSTDAERD